jgi:SAM-dependent methyltransferase
MGIEASHNMVALAQSNLHGTLGRVVHSKIEEWSYPAESFDLVISRLALHYVPNLDETFKNVNNTLRQAGKFVFSIVHPVITSCDRSREGGGIRQDWIVDDYFTTGPRKVRFMGKFVEQFHRTIEDIYKPLQDAGFQIEQLRESRPQPEHFADESLYERRKRIPLFLFLSGRKR